MHVQLRGILTSLAVAVGVAGNIQPDCTAASSPAGASLLQKAKGGKLTGAPDDIFKQFQRDIQATLSGDSAADVPGSTEAFPVPDPPEAAQGGQPGLPKAAQGQPKAAQDGQPGAPKAAQVPHSTPEPTTDSIPYHPMIFAMILIIGTSLHMMQVSWPISKKSELEASKDSIPSTETATGTLTENTHLLKTERLPAASSLLDLLPQSSAVALCRDGPDPDAITYRQLREQLQDDEFASAFLPQDRVALILENGQEMAVCMLAVMHAACAVPLNPTFTVTEIAAAMQQLQCTAAIVQRGKAGAAAQQAGSSLGVPVFTLQAGQGKLLSLQGPRPATRAEPVEKKNREVLMLKTSGTTSKGKVVTFTLERLSKAARYNARSIELGEGSVCLNMMPLYHIAGISVNLLASLSAGATVLFYSGLFDVKRFTAELERPDEHQPTWYFAVPAVHEAVLSHIAELGRPFQHRLRLIRSAGAALPQKTGLRLIETFACAVTPAYGMTEALEITCPPANYHLERPGSVGPSINAEIKTVNGEVCIRGDLVMPGYEFHGPAEDDPNVEAWTGGSAGKGYLRTGDLGHMDSDGWLFLTGRCKEMINRGGETLNPHEIEPAVANHPEIDIVVCFAAPHQALGECVAAAVVLKKGASPQDVTPKKILEQCSSRASETMRPEVFVYLPAEALPKTATKKFIRAGLAGRLGLTLEMVKTSTAFIYNEASGSLEPAELEPGEVAVKDSLGQLRQASNQEVIEQQLKDGLFGFAIIQVIMKHWYQGRYNDLMAAPVRAIFGAFAEAELFTMSLFFLLSGHTAYQTAKSGGTALLKRWAGLYICMSVTCIADIATSSQRVDWYFAWLLMTEISTVAISTACSKLPVQGLFDVRWLSAPLTTIPWLLCATWLNSLKLMDLEWYQQWSDTSSFSLDCPLTAKWKNMAFGNINMTMGNWACGLLCCWAACVSIGFHLLPPISQFCWSSKDIISDIASNRSVRVASTLGFIFLICAHSDWPHHPPNSPEGMEVDFWEELFGASGAFLECLLTIVLLAIAIGPHSSFLQTLGKYSVGCLISQTLFENFEHLNFCIKTGWPLHDCVDFHVLSDCSGPVVAVAAMMVAPIMFALSFGKWTTQLLDVVLQHPALGVLVWPVFVASSPLISATIGTDACHCPVAE